MKRADASGARYALAHRRRRGGGRHGRGQAAARVRRRCGAAAQLAGARVRTPLVIVDIARAGVARAGYDNYQGNAMAVYDLEEQDQLDDLKAWWTQ